MPLFSIVIPTYNGAHLLRFCLQGALEQDFDDYEIIVSDNVSSDDTREVVADLGGDRVRYVRPEKHMNAADHWDFAVRHAEGKYIMMLGDDDCMVPKMLSTLSGPARSGNTNVISYAVGRYYHPDYFKPSLRNQLQIRPFSGKTSSIDALDQLRIWQSMNNYIVPPPSALISRQVIETVISRVGRFFFNPCPDYCAFAMAFSFGGTFIHIDRPLLAFGRSNKSTGDIVFWGSGWSLDKGVFKKKRSVEWYEEADDLYELVPLKGHYFINGFAESLLKARRALPEQFLGFELSWETYYEKYYLDMQAQKIKGFDTKRDMLEFKSAVSKLPYELRKEVRKRVSPIAIKPNIYRIYQTLCEFSILQPTLTKLRGMVLGDRHIIVNGKDAGFSNILECARQLEVICSAMKTYNS